MPWLSTDSSRQSPKAVAIFDRSHVDCLVKSESSATSCGDPELGLGQGSKSGANATHHCLSQLLMDMQS